MADDKSSLEQHLQSSVYGTPKINPDEQRKYLGTFRERVSLTISVGQLNETNWLNEFKQELITNHLYTVIFNGNIDSSTIQEYIRLTTSMNINFTIKTDPQYHQSDDNFAIVVTAKTAIHVDPIDISKKYPKQQGPISKSEPKPSIWKKLFG